MLNLSHCVVETEDGIHPPVEEAYVVAIGDSPNSRVRISHLVNGKHRILDRLTHCAVSRQGDTWTFVGCSDRLHEIAPDDDMLTITATPARGCIGCRGGR